MSNYLINDKPGLRHKFFSESWEAPYKQHTIPPFPEWVRQAFERSTKGEPLAREDFPQTSAVYDQKCFRRNQDLFYVSCFFAVQGALAAVLKDFDLGSGGLIPDTIYESDEKTEVPGPFYLLNFGARKDTFLPEKSTGIRSRRTMEKHGHELWANNMNLKDGDIAISEQARSGPDLWFEPQLENTIFMSGRLHDAILAAKVRTDFQFARARIVEVDGGPEQ